MHQWIEVKYKRLITECDWCGSTPHFLLDKGTLIYVCDSCCNKLTLKDYLEENHPELYQYYLNDTKQITGIPYHPFIKKNDPQNNIDAFSNVESIQSLPNDHIARKYLNDRKVPDHWQNSLYYTDNVLEWARKLMPEKYEKSKTAKIGVPWHEVEFDRSYNKIDQIRYWYDELYNVENLGSYNGIDDCKSIIIPLRDKENNCVGAVCRNISPDCPRRFMRVNWVDGASYMFGLERIDFDKTIYVMEGHIDKMFVPNSVSVGGIHFGLVWQRIIDVPFEKVVIVLDNEPGDRYTTRMYGNAIKSGYKIFVWPKHLTHKDINELALDGYTSEQIKDIIDSNTFQGEEALKRLTL